MRAGVASIPVANLPKFQFGQKRRRSLDVPRSRSVGRYDPNDDDEMDDSELEEL